MTTMSPKMLNLNEIKAACEKASSSPWIVNNGKEVWLEVPCDVQVCECIEYDLENDICIEEPIANAHFIANSRQWVPELVAEVERLEMERDEWKKEAEMWEQIAKERNKKLEARCERLEKALKYAYEMVDYVGTRETIQNAIEIALKKPSATGEGE